MPRRDGTGPDGKGAKTGRGLGNCVGYTAKPIPNPGRPFDGRGRGRGRRPRGRR